jgi:adenosylcobinamide kinase / adenosylcobinamide-phosphate guanylyltransferase
VSPPTKTRRKTITFVLGGAQSGKSYYAQRLAAGFERVTFIATAEARDAEMRKKIARHRSERPADWRTVEAPVDLCARIRSESANADAIIVDCLTVYVANVMGRRTRRRCNPEEHIDELCDAIQAANASVILVSNEVGSGVVPPYRSGRVFRDFLGQLNRKVAEIADTIVLMVAGFPVMVKARPVHGGNPSTGVAEAKASEMLQSANGVRKGY